MTRTPDVIVCGVATPERLNGWGNVRGRCDDCGRDIAVPYDAVAVERKVCTKCAMEIAPEVERVIREVARLWRRMQ